MIFSVCHCIGVLALLCTTTTAESGTRYCPLTTGATVSLTELTFSFAATSNYIKESLGAMVSSDTVGIRIPYLYTQLNLVISTDSGGGLG